MREKRILGSGCNSEEGHLVYHVEHWVWTPELKNNEKEKEKGGRIKRRMRGEGRLGREERRRKRRKREGRKLSLYTSMAWVHTCELCMSASFQFVFELGHPYKLLIFSPNLIFLKFSVFEKIIARAKHVSHQSWLLSSLIVHIQLNIKWAQPYL